MATKKGAGKGTGGHGRRRLEGKGPTPPAKERTGHPAQRRAAAAARRNVSARGARGRRDERPDVVVGRNPVVGARRARGPAIAMYVHARIDTDDRVVEAVRAAGDLGIPLLEVGKPELDRLSGRAVHQGLALAVPPYSYADPADLLARALESPAPLLVALDGVTDPHNLGAVVRSAAAFGAQGVVVPERRAAGMTAVAWKASAGAAARLPVARATNLVRALTSYADAGLLVVGLAAGGDVTLDDFEAATDPLVLVVGSEGRGLSRLVAERCDLRVAIPMAAGTESLNASVAAGVALAEIARRRRR
jgi:23S rRNA (guanosine2251-2'-O)-methyltransferase